MAQQVINVGARGDDGTGDPLRIVSQKANANFTELYAANATLNTNLSGKASLAGATFTGAVTLAGAAPNLVLNKSASGQQNIITAETAGVIRWVIAAGNATSEAGSNSGSDLEVTRYSDAGAALGQAIRISRDSGDLRLCNDGGRAYCRDFFPRSHLVYGLGSTTARWLSVSAQSGDFSGALSCASLTVGGAAIAGGLPVGAIIEYAATAPPAGYLECDGAALSRATYAALFAIIGTTFGAGDGSTTFNLPDRRGVFGRGWDHGRGLDSGRAFGSYQADAFASHTHSNGAFFYTTNYADSSQYYPGAGVTSVTTTGASGSTETRPKNIAVMICIKY